MPVWVFVAGLFVLSQQQLEPGGSSLGEKDMNTVS